MPVKINDLRIVKINAYSKAVVAYMIRWAELMEKEPNLTKEKAEELSHKADIEGITGFMYDMARKCLYKFWQRGEELKRSMKKCSNFYMNSIENLEPLT